MEKFKMPKDLWLKFGCFLTGHNYTILSECSEASKRDQKKMTSAMVIIVLLWSIIGFIFTQKYLNSNILGSIIGSLIMCVIIIQVERQIILTTKLKNGAKIFRIALGVIVATIGATIVDQHLFANDIAKIASDNSAAEADKNLEIQKKYLTQNSILVDSQIAVTNVEIEKLKLKRNNLPQTIDGGQASSEFGPDGKLIKKQSGARIPNPAILDINETIKSKTSRIESLENEKMRNTDVKLRALTEERENIRKAPPGFLKELSALIPFLRDNPIALIFYLIWFSFFVLIECLVLVIKNSSKDKENDYEKIVAYQQKIREQRLMILEDKRNAALGSDQNIDATNSLITNIPK